MVGRDRFMRLKSEWMLSHSRAVGHPGIDAHLHLEITPKWGEIAPK